MGECKAFLGATSSSSTAPSFGLQAPTAEVEAAIPQPKKRLPVALGRSRFTGLEDDTHVDVVDRDAGNRSALEGILQRIAPKAEFSGTGQQPTNNDGSAQQQVPQGPCLRSILKNKKKTTPNSIRVPKTVTPIRRALKLETPSTDANIEKRGEKRAVPNVVPNPTSNPELAEHDDDEQLERHAKSKIVRLEKPSTSRNQPNKQTTSAVGVGPTAGNEAAVMAKQRAPKRRTTVKVEQIEDDGHAEKVVGTDKPATSGGNGVEAAHLGVEQAADRGEERSEMQEELENGQREQAAEEVRYAVGEMLGLLGSVRALSRSMRKYWRSVGLI